MYAHGTSCLFFSVSVKVLPVTPLLESSVRILLGLRGLGNA